MCFDGSATWSFKMTILMMTMIVITVLLCRQMCELIVGLTGGWYKFQWCLHWMCLMQEWDNPLAGRVALPTGKSEVYRCWVSVSFSRTYTHTVYTRTHMQYTHTHTHTPNLVWAFGRIVIVFFIKFTKRGANLRLVWHQFAYCIIFVHNAINIFINIIDIILCCRHCWTYLQ